MRKSFIRYFCLICAVAVMFCSFYKLSVVAEEINYEPITDHIQYVSSEPVSSDTNYIVSTIYTPAGSVVQAKIYQTDYTGEEKYVLYTTAHMQFPNAVMLSAATKRYNCHSYAWYSQTIQQNNYWIEDPSAYIADGSVVETSVPSVGAIVCYYDGWGDIIHSGVVHSITGDEIIVDSKWRDSPLFRHELEYCPDWADTEYVKYYTFHNFVYTVKGEGTHYVTCTDCDFSTTALHVWGENPNPGQGYICERCYYTASSIPEIQSENTVLLIK